MRRRFLGIAAAVLLGVFGAAAPASGQDISHNSTDPGGGGAGCFASVTKVWQYSSTRVAGRFKINCYQHITASYHVAGIIQNMANGAHREVDKWCYASSRPASCTLSFTLKDPSGTQRFDFFFDNEYTNVNGYKWTKTCYYMKCVPDHLYS